MSEPRRPEVTLVRTSAPLPRAAVEPEQPRSARRYGGLVVAAAAVVLLVGIARSGEPAPPVPGAGATGAPDASLVVQARDLSVTQGGVLVLPVELRNGAQRLQVRSASAYAEPVVQDPVLQAPTSVAPGARRRFVALVAPDCRLLRPGSTIEFRATVLLRVAAGSVPQDLTADLAAAPGVRERVAGLCRGR